MYINNSLIFTTQNDLNENIENIEFLSVESVNKNSKTLIISTICRPPQRETKPFHNSLRDL